MQIESVESMGIYRSMKYQLVIQWPASKIKDYDDLIGIEDILIKNLSDRADVDGHDAGVGEMNIFITTNDPIRAFEEVRAILGSKDFWIDARIAYRETNGQDYTIIWPKDLITFEVR